MAAFLYRDQEIKLLACRVFFSWVSRYLTWPGLCVCACSLEPSFTGLNTTQDDLINQVAPGIRRCVARRRTCSGMNIDKRRESLCHPYSASDGHSKVPVSKHFPSFHFATLTAALKRRLSNYPTTRSAETVMKDVPYRPAPEDLKHLFIDAG